MWVGQTILLGLALSMDAFAVTVANAFAYPKSSKARSFMAPVAFGVFQGIMPLIGYFLGTSVAAELIISYHGIIAFVILVAIGAKMVWDGASELRRGAGPSECRHPGKQTVATIVLQAVATSIDALAIGVTYVNGSGAETIWTAVSIIALTTFLTCSVAWLFGRRFGHLFGAKAQIVGGVVLICIGLKELFF